MCLLWDVGPGRLEALTWHPPPVTIGMAMFPAIPRRDPYFAAGFTVRVAGEEMLNR